MENFVPYKKWLHQHDEKIKAEFADRPTEEVAEETEVNYYTVSRRATRLGVKKSAAFMRTSIKKGGRRHGIERKKRNADSESYLREHFADTRSEDIARHLGVDVKTVRRWARRLGLVKSEAFMQKSRTKGGLRNGYYTPEQEAWRKQRIAEVYPDGDEAAMQRLADELGVACSTIVKLACRYGIRRSEASMQAFKAKAAERATRYGPEFVEELRAYYPTHTNEECAERFGMSKGSVFQLARRHGIRKTAGHKSRIYAQNHRKKRG